MKLHLITIGKPKLDYASRGWQEYYQRLGHYHPLRVTHLADKHNDAAHILDATENTFLIALDGQGQGFSSPELAAWLDRQAQAGREISFVIGGPEGLPREVIEKADLIWSLSALTFPHDLAMVILLEALYRASAITAGHPYHK